MPGAFPAPPPANYGNPFDDNCLDGEVTLSLGSAGRVCTPQCTNSADCPTSKPEGVSATPACDQGSCSLVCDPSDQSTCGAGDCISWGRTNRCVYTAATPVPAPIHPCDDGSHGCDPAGGKCITGAGSSWTCECDIGLSCVGECGLAGGYEDGFQISSSSAGASTVAVKATETAGLFDTLMCRPQATAIYGSVIADEMAVAGVFDRCVDEENSSVMNEICAFGVCLWGEAPVPYYVNGGSELANIVELSARELETRTNARFTRLGSPAGSYIEIVNSNQCGGVSVLGKKYGGGSQKLEAPTAADCQGSTTTAVSVTVHEIMHAMGLFHEQTRPDRDEHVTINYQNIEQGTTNFNYKKRGQQKVDELQLPYDFQSIMHYGADTFCIRDSANRCVGPTMVAKNGQYVGGQKLTDVDKAKINGLYPRQRHVCKSN